MATADRRASITGLQHTKDFPCHLPAWQDIVGFIPVAGPIGVRPHVARCKLDPLTLLPGLVLSHHASFCRKTTLTKHFKRYHPIKAEDSGMPDVDEEDEDGCADSDEEDSCSESEVARPDTQMKRQSSYYGDHWPLPCETAQLPNPFNVQGQLALRPKSTVDRVKFERPRSVSPQLIRSIPPADGSTSAFQFSRGRTMSIQTQMDQNFNQMPMSTTYPHEQRATETSSPCQFPMEGSMDSLTSPTTIQSSPTAYSDMSSSIPDSAHSTLFFVGPTSQPYVPHEETASMVYPAAVPTEEIPQDAGHQPMYDADYKPMIQAYDIHPMIPQQQSIQSIAYNDGANYYVPMDLYPGPAPAWYTNIKPEESWPGLMPSERLNMSSGWNQ
ncbi:MAG: hypothetical protein Q9218_004251 [Villophora microphyllina]